MVEGQIFGEEDLVQGKQKRSYTALCESSEGELYVIRSQVFLQRIYNHKIYKKTIQELLQYKNSLFDERMDQVQKQYVEMQMASQVKAQIDQEDNEKQVFPISPPHIEPEKIEQNDKDNEQNIFEKCLITQVPNMLKRQLTEYQKKEEKYEKLLEKKMSAIKQIESNVFGNIDEVVLEDRYFDKKKYIGQRVNSNSPEQKSSSPRADMFSILVDQKFIQLKQQQHYVFKNYLDSFQGNKLDDLLKKTGYKRVNKKVQQQNIGSDYIKVRRSVRLKSLDTNFQYFYGKQLQSRQNNSQESIKTKQKLSSSLGRNDQFYTKTEQISFSSLHDDPHEDYSEYLKSCQKEKDDTLQTDDSQNHFMSQYIPPISFYQTQKSSNKSTQQKNTLQTTLMDQSQIGSVKLNTSINTSQIWQNQTYNSSINQGVSKKNSQDHIKRQSIKIGIGQLNSKQNNLHRHSDKIGIKIKPKQTQQNNQIRKVSKNDEKINFLQSSIYQSRKSTDRLGFQINLLQDQKQRIYYQFQIQQNQFGIYPENQEEIKANKLFSNEILKSSKMSNEQNSSYEQEKIEETNDKLFINQNKLRKLKTEQDQRNINVQCQQKYNTLSPDRGESKNNQKKSNMNQSQNFSMQDNNDSIIYSQIVQTMKKYKDSQVLQNESNRIDQFDFNDISNISNISQQEIQMMKTANKRNFSYDKHAQINKIKYPEQVKSNDFKNQSFEKTVYSNENTKDSQMNASNLFDSFKIYNGHKIITMNSEISRKNSSPFQPIIKSREEQRLKLQKEIKQKNNFHKLHYQLHEKKLNQDLTESIQIKHFK